MGPAQHICFYIECLVGDHSFRFLYVELRAKGRGSVGGLQLIAMTQRLSEYVPNARRSRFKTENTSLHMRSDRSD